MNKRGSGILLHITSLPSSFGIGDLGPEAYNFVDFLVKSKQRFWQVLPCNPINTVNGNSPYSSISAYAGNSLLISPELLISDHFLDQKDLPGLPAFTKNRCNYKKLYAYKHRIFNKAYERFKANNSHAREYENFCNTHAFWLNDFALFSLIKKKMKGKAWSSWEIPLRDRNPKELQSVIDTYHDDIEYEKFLQYLFFRQWALLKEYCYKNNIQLIGDIPIYISYDSADVWIYPDLFKLDENKRPCFVAGVPPDYFSSRGQLWGNPVYNWEVLKEQNYYWWFQRMKHSFSLFDIVRIDHFRGFVEYWEVAATEKTAVKGRWVQAPAMDFFTNLIKTFPRLPIIAEDLGIITPDVVEVMKRFGFPGMKVLLFAFADDSTTHPYLPHNYTSNCIVYTGTHDNNTILGWFKQDASTKDRHRLFNYLGRRTSIKDIHWELIRLAMMSVGNTVIIPMQDFLGLDERYRMNLPGTINNGNWGWRLVPEQIDTELIEKIAEMTITYGR